MDTSIDDSNKQKVIDIVNTFEAVKKIEHFNSTPVGYRYQISFTIYVDGHLSTFESHEIANKIEKIWRNEIYPLIKEYDDCIEKYNKRTGDNLKCISKRTGDKINRSVKTKYFNY